eukprot:SAG31_NODE_3557_length_4124_cov_8.785342_5_plen_375_part_01
MIDKETVQQKPSESSGRSRFSARARTTVGILCFLRQPDRTQGCAVLGYEGLKKNLPHRGRTPASSRPCGIPGSIKPEEARTPDRTGGQDARLMRRVQHEFAAERTSKRLASVPAKAVLCAMATVLTPVARAQRQHLCAAGFDCSGTNSVTSVATTPAYTPWADRGAAVEGMELYGSFRAGVLLEEIPAPMLGKTVWAPTLSTNCWPGETGVSCPVPRHSGDYTLDITISSGGATVYLFYQTYYQPNDMRYRPLGDRGGPVIQDRPIPSGWENFGSAFGGPQIYPYHCSWHSNPSRSSSAPNCAVLDVAYRVLNAGTHRLTSNTFSQAGFTNLYHGGVITCSCSPVSCPANSAGANVPSGCSCNAGFSGSISATTS